MTVQSVPAKREIFYQELKKVLLNLYDPTVINSSCLFDWLGVEPGARSSFLLQDLMTQAIEALKPGPKVPVSAKSWRSYHLLRQRYIEQFNQEEIAANLSVSTRQVQREEKIAREVLLDYLWVKYHLEEKPLPRGLESAVETPPPSLAAASLAATSSTAQTVSAAPSSAPSIREELLHIAASVSKTPIQLTQVILQVVSTLTPFLTQLGVTIELAEQAPQTAIEAPEPVLRQALNQLLISAAKVCTGGMLRIEISSSPAEVLFTLTGTGSANDHSQARELFELAADMIVMCGGKMSLPTPTSAPQNLQVQLSFPVEKLIPVLIVDDNSDSLQLFQRYLTGSPFQPTLLQNPREVLNTAIALKPACIVIDIMMPGLDGWMILSQLRKHPATETIPVVVSTILPQRELALSLGVADFLPKPVKQDQLLEILTHLVNPEAQRPG